MPPSGVNSPMWQIWLVMSAARRAICRRIALTKSKEEETRGRVVVAWITELNCAAASSVLDGILASISHLTATTRTMRYTSGNCISKGQHGHWNVD